MSTLNARTASVPSANTFHTSSRTICAMCATDPL
jgi:hypothetical protein